MHAVYVGNPIATGCMYKLDVLPRFRCVLGTTYSVLVGPRLSMKGLSNKSCSYGQNIPILCGLPIGITSATKLSGRNNCRNNYSSPPTRRQRTISTSIVVGEMSLTSLIDFGLDLATNPKHLRWLCPLLLAADAILCVLIVWKVPCRPSSPWCSLLAFTRLICVNGGTDTEIDWTAYMEQVTQYVNGERDYTLIKGGTGPLVYPAAHVYIYTALYYLTKGGNIFYGQIIFGGLYLVTLALVMACYRLAKVSKIRQMVYRLN
jgi:hypothetical protein